ncbi:MAG TPA: hypothetical protein VIK35_04630 [Verrucomicrobiae bacterium]
MKTITKKNTVVGYQFTDANEREKYRRRKFEGRTVQHFTLSNVRELCRLASNGNQIALALAWSAATELSQTILKIASTPPLERVKQPRKMIRIKRIGRVNHWRRLKGLKKIARRSLYMPSVLSRSKSFNNLMARLPEKLNLSKNLAASNQPNLRLDSPTTRFTVELFERFNDTRTGIQQFANAYRNQPDLKKKLRQGMKVSVPGRKTPVKWSCRTLDDYLVKHLDFCPEDLSLLELGRLGSATYPDWWNKVFKPHLEKDYAMHLLRGTPLHRQLCAALDVKASDRFHDSKIREELKRRCQDALERLAKSLDPSKPPPENR